MATYLDELVQKIVTKADLKGFDDLERKQKRAIKSNDLLAKSFRRAFGIFFGIQGVRSIVKTYTELDDLQRVLNGISGGAEAGAKQFAFLKREAFRTATDITTIANAYKGFYAAASGAGFNMTQSQGIFSSILTAGRGIGASQQQIGGALVAIEQMLSKGKVSAEELRRQLGNALPGAVQIAAKAMGVLPAQFEEMMKKGISANEFVALFAKQAEKDLGKGMQENVKSLNAEMTNLGNAWKLLIYEVMKENGTGQSIAEAVREITQLLMSPELKKALDLIGKAATLIIKNIKTILILFGINKILQYINSFKRLHIVLWEIATTTNKASKATQLLATAYVQLTSGQVVAGIKSLTNATKGLIAPWVKLLGVLGAVFSLLIMILDVYETFINKNPDSLLNRAGSQKQNKKGAYEGLGMLGGAALLGGTGFAVGGPWGAAIGAGIGALYGKYGLGRGAYEAEQIVNPENIGPPFPIYQNETRIPNYQSLFPYSYGSTQTSTKASNINFNPTFNLYNSNLNEKQVEEISINTYTKLLQLYAVQNGISP